MIRSQHSSKGFTLIELLVYIAISSILMLSLVAHIVLMNQLENRSEVVNVVATEIGHVESVLVHTMRGATTIVSPSPGNTDSELILSMKDQTLGEAQLAHTGDTITLEDDIQSALPLASEHVRITSVSFQNVSRLETTGSIVYDIAYEWVDETGVTQVGNVHRVVSLR